MWNDRFCRESLREQRVACCGRLETRGGLRPRSLPAGTQLAWRRFLSDCRSNFCRRLQGIGRWRERLRCYRVEPRHPGTNRSPGPVLHWRNKGTVDGAVVSRYRQRIILSVAACQDAKSIAELRRISLAAPRFRFLEFGRPSDTREAAVPVFAAIILLSHFSQLGGVLSWIRHHSDLRGGKPVQRIRKEFTKAFRALAGW